MGPPSDTYALACVLYEMLVGEPPYLGNAAQAVLGKIIQGLPVSATAVRKAVPPNVDAAIRKALEKLPADRFTGAQDFARALADPGFHGEVAGAGVAAGVAPWKRLAVGFAALAAAFALALGWTLLRPEPPAPVARFSSPFEEGQLPRVGSVDLTADGSALVYVGPGASGAGTQLWIRRWADLDATPIRGTEGVVTSTLSPDGREVAFAGFPGSLRVVALDGGPSRTLVEQITSVNDWSSDGAVYFTGVAPAAGLRRVPATGGGSEAVEVVTELLEGELAHGSLVVLPGEKMGVFQVWYALDGADAEVWAIDLDTRERRFLTAGNTPRYASTGHLLFGTPDGALMAAPIDPGTAELTGPSVPVAEGLTVGVLGNVVYAVSESGTLIYRSGGGSGGAGVIEAVWVTRSGDAAPVDPGWRFDPGTPGFALRLSPDGAQLALTTLVDRNVDIWIKQLPDGPLDRLTFDDQAETDPVWSADGQFVTYVKNESGNYDVWRRRADGTGAPELLLDDERSLHQVRWSPDRGWMVFRAGAFIGPSGERDIVGFRPGVDSATIPLVATAEFAELDPALSPDGRWLAYTSDETGREEVYVRPFPNVDSTRVRVSTDGGFGPLWAHSGSELFFVGADQGLVAAEVEADSGFRVLQRETLFALGAEYGGVDRGGFDFYDIAPDDQRFLMVRLAVGALGGESRVILVQNFFEELKARMGG